MQTTKATKIIFVAVFSLMVFISCSSSNTTSESSTNSVTETALVAEPTTMPSVGEQIIYTQYIEDSQTNGVYRISFDGGDKQLLFTCPNGCQINSLSISPDSRKIAYVTQTDGLSGTLHLVNTEGTNDRILTNADFIGPQAFSLNGTQLVFGRYRAADTVPVPEISLWIYDVATGIEQQITPWEFFVGPATWVDQQHLVFFSSREWNATVGMVNIPSQCVG
ncbi:MAG: hypothetical protein GFH27_549323n148 [Chloroflexi bacterium AL-W]|nr:hypothetical protein [Chloroflexi bacterium AL-N1]NOK70299.1 hypothetical protein [Chloroflexi bacterium AL-N10]NOK77836.1 hypothetical protein [Chloroflexi bacterium AL-N5]NOK84845.1 hypothetical protein [Chloroflexi bacterium AL-W]NOK92452.1 hypothetical protein [Chloroflexi bacterium AL-N15]